MHPFGGTQVCPRCSKAVYAAEQVMGPGRKLYHKPCLSCMICKKRLDSYTLLEHDQEPYCKSCYTKNFSTRDLRQANLPVREASASPTPVSPPRSTSNTSTAPLLPPRATSPIRRPNTGTLSSLPRLTPTHSLSSPTSPTFTRTAPTSLRAVPEASDKDPEPGPASEAEESADTVPPLTDSSPSPALTRPIPPTPDPPAHRSSSSVSSISSINTSPSESKRFSSPSFSTFSRSNNTTSAALSLLENQGINPLVPTTTGTRYGAALGGTVTVNMTASPTGGSPRKWGAETPLCPKCSQRVYFAEQARPSSSHSTLYRVNTSLRSRLLGKPGTKTASAAGNVTRFSTPTASAITMAFLSAYGATASFMALKEVDMPFWGRQVLKGPLHTIDNPRMVG